MPPPSITTPTPRAKKRRSPLLLALAAVSALLAPGCAHCKRVDTISQLAIYSRVTASDFEGKCIAEYIAEGPVEETRGGFTFRAVERRIYHPCALAFRYPLGRPVVVIATNIVVDLAPPPAWLASIAATPQ